MKKSSKILLEELFIRYPQLVVCRQNIEQALELLIECYAHKGKLLVCGNGGSAADAEHIVGELMKSFKLSRKLEPALVNQIKQTTPATAKYLTTELQQPLEAISLVCGVAISTACANDQSADLVFAQQVLGHGRRGDVLLAISTSGNSSNVIYAAQVAQALGLNIIGLIGGDGGKLRLMAGVSIIVPEVETFRIQELHLPIYHALCAALEEEFFGEEE